MTDPDDIPEAERDEALAAEHALRLLDGAEAEAAARRAATEPAFAARVAAWEARLAPLAGDLAPVEPDAATRRALLRRLFPEAARPSRWGGTLTALLGAAGGALAAAVLVLALLPDAAVPPGGGLHTAEIVAAEGDFRAVAVVDADRAEIVLTRLEGAAPPGRILQVWAHGPDEPARSVGLWPEGESVRLPLPVEIAAVRGTLTLGVSEEPPGGSPTGSPSGRVFGTVDLAGFGRAL